MTDPIENNEKALLGIIGLCKGAGKAIVGVPMICEAMQKRAHRKGQDRFLIENKENTDFIVIEASDTSENTHKRITDKCAYYKIGHIKIMSTCEALGRSVGKGAVAAVAIADRNFCRAVLSKLSV